MPNRFATESGFGYHARMADTFTKAKRSEVMATIHSRGNAATEGALLSIFRRNRIIGWRRQFPLEGRPDFVFPQAKIVVFVDGCFWHACPRHFRMPRSNRSYWNSKIARNRRRDKKVTRVLRLEGWTVLRIWQHQLADEGRVIGRIRTAISRKIGIEFARRV